jgi:hypothetical protein
MQPRMLHRGLQPWLDRRTRMWTAPLHTGPTGVPERLRSRTGQSREPGVHVDHWHAPLGCRRSDNDAAENDAKLEDSNDCRSRSICPDHAGIYQPSKRARLRSTEIATETCRRAPGGFAKGRRKCAGLAEAEFERDLGDRRFVLGQQGFGAFHAPLRVIAVRRHAE